MSFPRYPKYKPSGVEWLGDVPAHWDVTRLKRVCTASPSNIDKKSYDGEQSVRLCNYTDVYYNDFITADLDFMAATASQAQIEKFTLRAGDTIITKDSETADDIAVAAFVPDDLPGVVCGYHLSVIRPRSGTAGSFVKWWFASRFAKSSFAVRANGLTRVGLGQHELENVELALPPLPEQRAIAAFLDRETAKIDGLVAAQRRLIALLKEKRQGVVSHAVTKGLDPKAPMKPSGVEWLGDVPAHWEMKRLRRVCGGLTVGIVVNPSGYVSDEGLPFVYGGDIREERIDCDGCRKISAADSDLQPKTRLQPGDLLTVRVGAPGVTAVVPEECRGGNCASVMLIRRGAFDSDWLCYVMNSRVTRFQVEQVQYGAAQEQFNISHAVDFWIPTPPVAEQRSLAAKLRELSDCLSALATEAESAITLLQERRSALISAAVTGQIDVRNAATTEAA
jgi:type I restriction enzyme, S subunit